jgi:hypothetical protein
MTDSDAEDIHTFLRNGMDIVRQRHKIYNLTSDWPGKAIIRDLAKRSTSLFIWASIAANFIREGHDPQEQLDVLLSAGLYGTAEAALDALYATALGSIGKWGLDGRRCPDVHVYIVPHAMPSALETWGTYLDFICIFCGLSN